MNPFTKRRKSRFAFIATCLLALLPTFASTNIFPVSQFDGLNLTAASKINRTFRQLESMYATGMGVTTNNSTNFVQRVGDTMSGPLRAVAINAVTLSVTNSGEGWWAASPGVYYGTWASGSPIFMSVEEGALYDMAGAPAILVADHMIMKPNGSGPAVTWGNDEVNVRTSFSAAQITSSNGFYGVWKGNGLTTNHQISGGHTLIISNGLIVGIAQ